MSAIESRLAAIIAEQMRADGWTCEYHEPTSREGECSGCDESLTRTARAAAAVIASADDLAVIEVPKVAYKAVGGTDADAYMGAAWRIEEGYAPGGSNMTAAVVELLRRVAKAAEGVSDRG